MTKNEHIKYLLEAASHDLETAKALFESEKYDWCLFIGHLVLEKTLKAYFVKENDNKFPPKIHNLVKLADLSNLELEEDKRILFDRINDFNIEVRYPEYKNEFYKIVTKDYAEKYLDKIKENYKWLKSLIK